MHIILLPLVWTHLISASSFTLKPQVRHILYIHPKLTSPQSVTEITGCYTGETLGSWQVLFGKDIFLRCFPFIFNLRVKIVLLIKYEKGYPKPNEKCDAKKKQK